MRPKTNFKKKAEELEKFCEELRAKRLYFSPMDVDSIEIHLSEYLRRKGVDTTEGYGFDMIDTDDMKPYTPDWYWLVKIPMLIREYGEPWNLDRAIYGEKEDDEGITEWSDEEDDT